MLKKSKTGENWYDFKRSFGSAFVLCGSGSIDFQECRSILGSGSWLKSNVCSEVIKVVLELIFKFNVIIIFALGLKIKAEIGKAYFFLLFLILKMQK